MMRVCDNAPFVTFFVSLYAAEAVDVSAAPSMLVHECPILSFPARVRLVMCAGST